MNVIKINDNISLRYIEMDKLKTTSVSVFLHRPLKEQDASYNALLPLVLKSGTELCPDRAAIARYLDGLYGATMGAASIKCGEDHVIYFDAETISDKYAPEGEPLMAGLLRLLMSVLFAPKASDGAFDEKITEIEKINAINKILAFVNDKRQYASTRCQQETARGTAFAINRLGDADKIRSITAKSLYEHYSSIIASSVIDIYVCGNTDINKAEAAIREYTDKLAFTPAAIPHTEILSRETGDVHSVTEEMNVAQGKLSMGFLTNVKPTDPDYDALVVFNSIFGAGAHSKLFNNVREKLSLAYYASSQLERFKGMIIVNAGIEFENYQKAYDETLVQLEEIKKGNITDHEFQSSKIALINSYNSYYDDQRALATTNLMSRVAGRDRSISDMIAAIEKVTVDDVVAVSEKLQLDTTYFLKGAE